MKTPSAVVLTASILAIFAAPLTAMEKNVPATRVPAEIVLPKPRRSGGKNIMECMASRQTTRIFSEKELSPMQISELLYAVCGINRPDKMKLTIPTAVNSQDLTVYAALKQGIYRYDPLQNRLVLILAGDHRAELGRLKTLHASAPLALLYVSERSKMKFTKDDAVYRKYAFFHAGESAQNVGLYCASAGLGNVVIGSLNEEICRKLLKLKNTETLLMGHLIGVPK